MSARACSLKGPAMSRRRRRWLYIGLYLLLVAISMLPLYSERPYDRRDTSRVILQLLSVSIGGYAWMAPLFHLATLGLVALIAMLGERAGRLLAAYMGLNYLVIGVVQTMGITPDYGAVIHTGAMAACAILTIAWVVVAIRGDLKPSLGPRGRRYVLLPLALFSFWAPGSYPV